MLEREVKLMLLIHLESAWVIVRVVFLYVPPVDDMIVLVRVPCWVVPHLSDQHPLHYSDAACSGSASVVVRDVA